jgi:hypothetical protein
MSTLQIRNRHQRESFEASQFLRIDAELPFKSGGGGESLYF